MNKNQQYSKKKLNLPNRFWEKVDAVGEKWAAALEAQDSVARQNCFLEAMDVIGNCLLSDGKLQDRDPQLWDNYVILTAELFTKRLKNFDPQKSRLSIFVNKQLGYMQENKIMAMDLDIQQEHYRIVHAGEETGKFDDQGNPILAKKTTKRRAFWESESMDAPMGEEADDAQTAHDYYGDDRIASMDAFLVADDQLELLMQLVQVNTSKKTPIAYMRLFFTDTAASYIREYDSAANTFRRESEMFRTMELMFLDFFMADRCRSIRSLCAAPLKNYSELVPGRPETPCPLPLQNDVFQSYLEKCENYRASASAISQQRKKYRQMAEVL